MNINGLKINTQAIGEGLYRIICQMNEEHIVAFGMIPAPIMERTEAMLREKVIAISAQQHECTVEEYKPFVSKEKLNEMVRPIMHEVSIAIFGAAKNAGKMIV